MAAKYAIPIHPRRVDPRVVAERLYEQMRLTPSEMVYLRTCGCRIGRSHRGSGGFSGMTRPARFVRSTLPVPPHHIIDTSGAGDVFHGACVHSYLANPGATWDEHFRFARAAASIRSSTSETRRGCPRLPILRRSGGNSKTCSTVILKIVVRFGCRQRLHVDKSVRGMDDDLRRDGFEIGVQAALLLETPAEL
jgi:hypothetical protein